MEKFRKFLKYCLAVLQGTLVGLAVVIPGVSGGSMLLTIGVYEDAVSITSKDKTIRRRAIVKLIPYALGIVLGVAALSFVITWLLEKFEFLTILLFCGLILGSLPMLFREIKGKKVRFGYFVVALLMAAIMILLPVLNNTTHERYDAVTDTVRVGDRILLSEEATDTPEGTLYEVKRAKDDAYIQLRNVDNDKDYFTIDGETTFALATFDNGTVTLTDANAGPAHVFYAYRTIDRLNNGIWTVLLCAALGFIAAGTMIVPGISGSMVLLVLGYYNSVMTHLKNFISAVLTLQFGDAVPHLLVLIPFGIGVLAGLFVVSKLIKWLLDRHPTPTYYGIIALMVTSPYAIFMKATCWGSLGANLAQWWYIPAAILCLAAGFFTAWGMTRKKA